MTGYIKDLQTGEIRKYGTDKHDSLKISGDGRTLSYYNLHCGEGSIYGSYRFCEEDGSVPEELTDLVAYGADCFFNIGGYKNKLNETLRDIITRIKSHKKALVMGTEAYNEVLDNVLEEIAQYIEE